MTSYLWLLVTTLLWLPETNPTPKEENPEQDQKIIRQIYDEALLRSSAYDWLDYLSNEIGGRLSGSPEAAMAVEYTRQMLDTLGLDSVWLQPVMVPHWVRGEKEQARILSPDYLGTKEVNICALGGSVGTESSGLTAGVVEVKSFDELVELGKDKIAGKIVFYNVPMNATYVNAFQAYGEAVRYRWAGAMKAAPYGAVAVLVRSMNLKIDKHPHAGSMGYADDESIAKIPAMAISTADAEELSSALRQDPNLKFYMRANCQTYPDVLSYNVIGEIKGSEHPDQVIVVGGHLDSWETGDGAHDDGAGCVQSIAVLQILKRLHYQPRYTIRAVMFMNEENGTRGGREYAAEAKRKGEQHLAAIESDAGGFTPRGFSINDTLPVVEQIMGWKPILKPYYLDRIEAGWDGADIGFLREQGTTCIALRPDSQRYFDYHHAETDKFDAINKRELELGAAAMTALVYLLDRHGLEKSGS